MSSILTLKDSKHLFKSLLWMFWGTVTFCRINDFWEGRGRKETTLPPTGYQSQIEPIGQRTLCSIIWTTCSNYMQNKKNGEGVIMREQVKGSALMLSARPEESA